MAGCAGSADKQAANISADTGMAADIKQHIAVLANDSLLGRKPFTKGEDKTIAYIADKYKKLGLEPGNNGSYYQEVPMVEITSTSQDMQISGAGSAVLKAGIDFVAATRREVDYP